MISFRLAALLYLLSQLFFSCQDENSNAESQATRYPLTFTIEDFFAHQDHKISAAAIDANLGVLLHNTSIELGSNHSAVAEFPEVFLQGGTYFIDYYADINGNGNCDTPPVDHVWRLAVDSFEPGMKLTDSHHMGFNSNCLYLNGENPDTSGTVLSVTGSIAIDAQIIDDPDLGSGQPLEGAVIFVEGNPDNTTTSDADGNFTLDIRVNDFQGLRNEPLNVLMWYTKPKEGNADADWSIADRRYGAIASINDTQSSSLELGATALWFTKGIVLPIEDTGGERQDMCWIRIPSLGYRSKTVYDAKIEAYRIDYLPSSTYVIKGDCQGFESFELEVEVDQASATGQWIKLDPLVLEE